MENRCFTCGKYVYIYTYIWKIYINIINTYIIWKIYIIFILLIPRTYNIWKIDLNDLHLNTFSLVWNQSRVSFCWSGTHRPGPFWRRNLQRGPSKRYTAAKWWLSPGASISSMSICSIFVCPNIPVFSWIWMGWSIYIYVYHIWFYDFDFFFRYLGSMMLEYAT